MLYDLEVVENPCQAGLSVILMGNTVDDFMRQMELKISRRVRLGAISIIRLRSIPLRK
ncbi:hypothetical protein [Methanococcoides sp. NM1]|uniref:hypothetical protein n=1 Tax=Methanococcoides sp. NM1 TaxID=1201013 RepID=UPI0014383FBD|nr:hypothetical protein [Methanococcoides sp. NM1]